MCCILREGYRHTSYGTKEVLPGTIERVQTLSAGAIYYSQALVICEQREVEFFIVAKRHRNLMNAVREIPESHWKSFAGSDLQAPIGAGGGAGGERI